MTRSVVPRRGFDDSPPLAPLVDTPPPGRQRRVKDHLGGIAPVSVIDIPVKGPVVRALRARVGDEGQLRNGMSVFPPALAIWMVEAYSIPGEVILDSYAGGGTRAVIAASLGREYVGIDVRLDEVERVNRQLAILGLDHLARIHEGDARTFEWLAHVEPHSAALNLTCPPYWCQERYGGGPRDLSSFERYADFLEGIAESVQAILPALRSGALAAWVVGRIVHPRTNELLDLPGHIEALHREVGYGTLDRVIVRTPSLATKGLGRFLERRRTGRTHEEIVVMQRHRAPGPRRSREETALDA